MGSSALGGNTPQGGSGQSSVSPLLMQALGVGQGVPMGFGDYGQEQMRQVFRQMLAANPADPIPFGLPPTSIQDMNKMLALGYNQKSALQGNNALKPPTGPSTPSSPYGV